MAARRLAGEMGRTAATTGPKTAEGKEWLADYEPDKPTFRDQVLRAAEGEWLLRRAVRRYDEAEQKLYKEEPDALAWTDEQHKLLERFGRYRTTAQRWFHRERGAAEQLRRARFSEGLRTEAARRREAADVASEEPVVAEPVAEPVVALPMKRQPVPAIVQDIEVNLDEQGQTVTNWWPPHEYVRVRARSHEEPIYVRRQFYFFCAVPPEYYWLTDNPAEREAGSRFWRTMPYAKWLELIEIEDRKGDGHLVGE